jgi:SET domain-containing protein
MSVKNGKSKVRVGIGRHGRGVFAVRPIKAGETIEVCPTLEVPSGEITGRLGDYVFESAETAGHSVLLLGYGMLYNHSADANAEYETHGEQEIAFVARRAIAPGDEITIDYGPEWWDSRGETPD